MTISCVANVNVTNVDISDVLIVTLADWLTSQLPKDRHVSILEDIVQGAIGNANSVLRTE